MRVLYVKLRPRWFAGLHYNNFQINKHAHAAFHTAPGPVSTTATNRTIAFGSFCCMFIATGDQTGPAVVLCSLLGSNLNEMLILFHARGILCAITRHATNDDDFSALNRDHMDDCPYATDGRSGGDRREQQLAHARTHRSSATNRCVCVFVCLVTGACPAHAAECPDAAVCACVHVYVMWTIWGLIYMRRACVLNLRGAVTCSQVYRTHTHKHTHKVRA